MNSVRVHFGALTMQILSVLRSFQTINKKSAFPLLAKTTPVHLRCSVDWGAQGDHTDPAKRLYSGVLDCFKKTMAEGGYKAFYKGFAPSITRAMPVNGAIFTGFTAAQRALN